jgi:hypothetical protein
MRSRVSSERVHALWKQQYPRTKYPLSVKLRVYSTTKKELNNLAQKSLEKKAGYYQNTKTNVKEYGKKSISPSTYDIHGLIYSSGRTKTILVNNNLSPREKTVAIKHELRHIHNKEY